MQVTAWFFGNIGLKLSNISIDSFIFQGGSMMLFETTEQHEAPVQKFVSLLK